MYGIQSTVFGRSRDSSPSKIPLPRKSVGLERRMSCFSASNISKAAPFMMALDKQLYQPYSPRTPMIMTPIQKDEVTSSARRQHQGGPSDESSVDNYFEIPYDADETRAAESPETVEEENIEQEMTQHERDVAEASTFLEGFIMERWETQLQAGYIKIVCNLTLDEIRELGRLRMADGTRECRKLITAPVLHDAIGHALWLEMANEIGRHKMTTQFANTSLAAVAEKEETPRPSVVKWSVEKEVAERRARSMRRRATEGDVFPEPTPSLNHSAPPTADRTRRKSEMPTLRPNQIMCTTCGSRAMPDYKSDEEQSQTDEDENCDVDISTMRENGDVEVLEARDSMERQVKKRSSISRRLSLKVNQTLTKFGEGLAPGYMYGGGAGGRVLS
ncbi:uncharacterized protein CCOS01_10413 [Colletotrichum costaricense]|uniref:Uncharacterized protein n=1 Tax=Colletotrichum costaricense TaxID=1209916 RepID=A0AAJ0DXB4_9PEZI|nr:uncharacterized protein CCOS01_10413 [Colletotrichum costaricense]KAK1520294.1 hypothetical protein CCOS01_10413 [Colletotrichum costaricense]